MKFAARLANPELLERVTSLNEQVLELSSKNVELQGRVFRLEKELQEANEKLYLIGKVRRRDGFIYHDAEPDPCCSHCFDSERILIRIVEVRDPKAPNGFESILSTLQDFIRRFPTARVAEQDQLTIARL